MPKKGACAVNVSTSDIRERSFATVVEGYDPGEVDEFLAELADALDDAAQVEHVTPGDRRDRMIEDARAELGRIRRMAEAGAERTMRDAADEAQRTMIDARRDALALMERSRAEADAVVTEARLEQAALEQRIIELRQVVRRTEHLLKAMASGALGDVAKAGTVLAAVELAAGDTLRVELEGDDGLRVDTSSPGAPATGDGSLPGSVDQLLNQLRDSG